MARPRALIYADLARLFAELAEAEGAPAELPRGGCRSWRRAPPGYCRVMAPSGRVRFTRQNPLQREAAQNLAALSGAPVRPEGSLFAGLR